MLTARLLTTTPAGAPGGGPGIRALPLVVSATACAAGLGPARAAAAQELGRAAPQACTREFRTLLLPVRDVRGRSLGPLRVRVRRARTGQLVHQYVEKGTPPSDGPADGAEIPPNSVPRGPARPLPYEEREVPGAPGTPAGVPRRPPPPTPSAPTQPEPPAHAASARIRVVDDGMLSRLHAAGDTLAVEVQAGRRVGRGRVIVAAGRGGCHVIFVSGPQAILLR